MPFPKPKFQTSGFFQFQSKSTTNLIDSGKYNTSMMLSPTHQRQMNISAIESSNNVASNVFGVPSHQNSQPFVSMRLLKSNHDKDRLAYKSK
jgi:hypothetical protein